MEEHKNIESIFQHIWKSICIGKKNQSKLCYFQNINPGSTIRKPDDIEQNLQDEMSKAFVIITVYIKKTDWLYLSHSGHKRVKFFDNKVNSGIWIAP